MRYVSLSLRTATMVNLIIVIAHNAKSFVLHFILNRAIFLRWRPKRIRNWQKILYMKFENMKFLDSLCYLPFPLRKLSSAVGLTASKSWYPNQHGGKSELCCSDPFRRCVTLK